MYMRVRLGQVMAGAEVNADSVALSFPFLSQNHRRMYDE